MLPLGTRLGPDRCDYIQCKMQRRWNILIFQNGHQAAIFGSDGKVDVTWPSENRTKCSVVMYSELPTWGTVHNLWGGGYEEIKGSYQYFQQV
jgi:hypothetical protein